MPTVRGSTRIAIVGAGIGGLAVAIALRQRGFHVELFEAAEVFRPVGAGILMQPNAMTVLARLGLADAVEHMGIPLERAGVWDAGDLTGGPLQDIDMRAVSARHGRRTVAILRSALQDILAGALAQPPHMGRRCTGVENVDGAHPRIRFASGETVEADVVIAADGIRSTVRASLFPDVRLRYSGQTSWRAVVDTDPGTPPGTAYEYWTPGFRVGFAGVAPGRTYWFTALDAPEGGRGDPAEELAMLRVRSRGMPAHVDALMARTDPAALVRTDLHDLRPRHRWWHGSIVLVGDAAHATTPNLGQGGAQALEDAIALADAMDAHGATARAFTEFERARYAKASRIVRMSLWTGKLGHLRSSLLRRGRNALMRSLPPALVMKQLDGIYRVPSPTQRSGDAAVRLAALD